MERTICGATCSRWAGPGLALGLAGALLLLPAAHAEPIEANGTRVATASVSPVEQSQEALLRELAQPPILPPEMFSELQYVLPAPIIGGLGVEVE